MGVTRTMHVSLEGPANALDLSKDCSKVVVAGRSVFKIFSIEEEEFQERENLRVGKNINLNFSCNDVVWSPIDDQLIATAATNGAVVVWNLSKTGRSKQEQVFNDHKRTVNKVKLCTFKFQLVRRDLKVVEWCHTMLQTISLDPWMHIDIRNVTLGPKL